ncbi:hypothetical protein [Nannocystis exedens]|uniref:hypothetical protein n=1 Tax=Nannocystis exedens TaxID=54 RepID=UPI000BB9FDFF|nr:hypothetical protein [Nannocystis exedens]
MHADSDATADVELDRTDRRSGRRELLGHLDEACRHRRLGAAGAPQLRLPPRQRPLVDAAFAA